MVAYDFVIVTCTYVACGLANIMLEHFNLNETMLITEIIRRVSRQPAHL